MEQQNISDYNLFMMCRAPREEAFAPLPAGFHFDLCRREELETWMRFPFDTQEEARQYAPYMARYFQNVYAAKEAEFFARCLFVREASGAPVGTAFLWRAYGRVNTLHWLKVRREYEGRGIGRALLTRLADAARAGGIPRVSAHAALELPGHQAVHGFRLCPAHGRAHRPARKPSGAEPAFPGGRRCPRRRMPISPLRRRPKRSSPPRPRATWTNSSAAMLRAVFTINESVPGLHRANFLV